ncbi:hypothetical protein C5E45_34295 [Nocardia nova]|uniref:Uncharacterized protein n=1 Tax=Nocardia nova TaxID=37330 RepID=A0A2S6A7T0_9NOCA|nr:hypothetical protein [Nocardia nova]PPJ18825.1 hypothetical protein C5E41_32070 [Nocardia nova]PPJ29052.1 hypothetical protein C5E45_34295 [Nocardia nova]
MPVLGTYWDGNSLRWAEGNPAGKQPGSFAPKGDGTISLQAHLFKLLTWNFDDIDEQYRPPVLAALAVANGAELHRKMFYGGIEIIANGLGADITKLTNSDTKKRDAELDKLKERGLPTGPLADAVKAWWKAKAPEDRARELLGEAGAIAMLKSDGWTVNPRPKGNYSHDIVAVEDGQVMVVEAKGGKGGA